MLTLRCRYIKHLDIAQSPWLPDSEFVQLDGECRAWYDSLPASLHFTSTSMYIRREQSQLGALIALHMMYHQNMCDLYRIGAPALYKLRSAFAFPPEQSGFLTHLQKSLFAHAKAHSMIIGEALRHGPHALADQWIPTIAYDGCRIMLYHITQLIDPTLESSKEVILETIPLVQNNVEALKTLQSMYAVAPLLRAAAEKMLERVVSLGAQSRSSGRSIIPDEPYPEDETETRETSRPGTPAQTAPDYVLNPLSIYRMARKAIPEKHEPEKHPHASSPVTTNDPRSSAWHVTPQQQLQRMQYDANNGTMGIREGADVTGSLLPSDSTGLDELLTMFTSDPSGLIWQPSDTALGSQMESNSLPPWEPAGGVDPQLDAWMPIMGQGQGFGYS